MSGLRSGVFPVTTLDECASRTTRPLAARDSVSADGTVSLAWTPGEGDMPISYLVEVGSASGRNDLAAFDTGSPTPGFVATNVPPGTYFVRVRAQNSFGASPPSNEIVVDLRSGCAGPTGVPTGLTARAAGAAVTLSWQAPTGGCPATRYGVEAGSAPGRPDLAALSPGGAATTLNADGVASGTYYVRVRAQNAAGTSAPSNEVSLTVRQ